MTFKRIMTILLVGLIAFIIGMPPLIAAGITAGIFIFMAIMRYVRKIKNH